MRFWVKYCLNFLVNIVTTSISTPGACVPSGCMCTKTMQLAFSSSKPLHGRRSCCYDAPSVRLHTGLRPNKCTRTVFAEASAADRLAEVADSLVLKNVKLQEMVQQEDYNAAVKQRDSINQLELQKRQLEIEAKQEAREKILHDIGLVIRHKRFEYRGVIIGYDPSCVAPEGWIKVMRVDSLPLGRNQPFYHVLVDDRDGQRPGNVTYVAQENIVTIRGQTEVEHPLINDYFRSFEDGRYVPTEKMRNQYPQKSESAEG